MAAICIEQQIKETKRQERKEPPKYTPNMPIITAIPATDIKAPRIDASLEFEDFSEYFFTG